jgi:phosphomannomutase
MIIDKIKERTGVKILPLCFAPCERLAHEGNPLKDENVKDLVALLGQGKADMGVAFDGDADRVFFFNKTGERIPTHAVACILAEQYLARHPKASIITDVSMPKVFQETVAVNGGAFLESRVGHTFIKQLMRERGAVFAAEVSGHFHFKDFFNADSGMFALMQILNILAHEQKTLAELARPFLTRFQSGELNYTIKDKQAALDALEKAFQDSHITRLDGLSAHFPDWWFNARPSNTEPFLRLNIEADTKELLESQKTEIKKIISPYINLTDI